MIRQIDKDSIQHKIIKDFAEKKHLPLQLRLDVLDVVFDIRPASRILVRVKSEVEEVCADIINAGLSISVGRGIRWQRKSTVLTCHDWFEDNIGGEDYEAMAILYLSTSNSVANDTRSADETKDDRVFGKALGYPNCCVDWVINRGKVPELAECIKLYTKDGFYDPLIWPGAMAVDAPLTPHYPCSIQCKKSQDIALSRIEALQYLGCEILIKRILDSRNMIYSINSNGQMQAHSSMETKALSDLACAKPLVPASERLHTSL